MQWVYAPPTLPVKASTSPVVRTKTGYIDNARLGYQIALEQGYSESDWSCLDKLVMNESGWNNLAQNKGSGAFGIFQFLNSTWAGTGILKSSEATPQIKAGLIYIKNRYQTPCKAYQFQVSHVPYWY